MPTGTQIGLYSGDPVLGRRFYPSPFSWDRGMFESVDDRIEMITQSGITVCIKMTSIGVFSLNNLRAIQILERIGTAVAKEALRMPGNGAPPELASQITSLVGGRPLGLTLTGAAIA